MAQLDDQARQRAHRLIERLAPGQVSAVVGLLEAMIDPFEHALARAPVDDEPDTAEESRELVAVRASLHRGEGISHEDILRDFGLTPDDFERMSHTPTPPSEK